MNYSELKKNTTETIFSANKGYTDSKHILNLCDKSVPADILERIEKGCPIEVLDEVVRDFPVCKYATQITIHGTFPALSTNRVGGYVNLCRNKNGSVGVRWSAIDNEKKRRLYKEMHALAGYHICENSTDFVAYKSDILQPDTAAAQMKAYRDEAERIDTSLFYGSATVRIGSFYGMHFVYLVVNVSAFYERNYDAIIRNVVNCDEAGLAAKREEYARKQAEERAKAEAERSEREARNAAAAAAELERKAAWVAANPCPFGDPVETTLQKGDIFAYLSHEGYGENARYLWKFAVVGVSFGRVTYAPCDIEGNREKYTRGHKLRKMTGKYRVKARKSAYAPVSRPSAPVARPAGENAVEAPSGAGVVISRNEAKNGIEIRFASRPSAQVLENLKAHGWRWSRFGGVWYKYYTEENMAFAESVRVA